MAMANVGLDVDVSAEITRQLNVTTIFANMLESQKSKFVPQQETVEQKHEAW